VCNAGIIRDRTIVNMTEDEWNAVVRVHLNGHFAPLHHAANHWKSRARERGERVDARLITTSSEAGLYGHFGQANYSAAKAGIVALTQVAARELAQFGVVANAICPRARTPMTEGVVDGMRPKPGEVDEWDPEAVAAVVAFLAGPHAAGLTGQVLVVHGPTVSRMREWRPVDEISLDAPLTLPALERHREELGDPGELMLAPFAYLLAKSGSLRSRTS
jgi:3-oxoacyl-[acyl-carrier protein] reductase